jgi:hypothetical protein
VTTSESPLLYVFAVFACKTLDADLEGQQQQFVVNSAPLTSRQHEHKGNTSDE